MTKKSKGPRKHEVFSTDRPITTRRQDKLGRGKFAEGLAQRIRSWRDRESMVISLCGEWGSGKTSLKNMVLERLRTKNGARVDLLEFNPWEISGHDSVTASFFRELAVVLNSNHTESASTKHRVSKLRAYAKLAALGGAAVKWVGKAITATGRAEGVFVETAAEAVTQSGEAIGQAADAHEARDDTNDSSLVNLKRSLAKEMAGLDAPILVVIDDIDRLTTDEVREVFQLVKANADFPNVIYLLLFDRGIVAGALNAISGNRGHEFLEKIVQVLFHVPQPPLKDVHKVLFDGLDAWLAAEDIGERWETPRWSHVWRDGLSEYFTNLRSVYRFLSSFGFQASQMQNSGTFELNPLDLLALETLRLFEPAFYELIPANRSLFVEQWRGSGFTDKSETDKEKLTELGRLLVAVPEGRRERVKELMKQLFPALFGHAHPDNDQLLRNLRVGHEKLFERYFSLGLTNDDVAQADIDALLKNISNPSVFERLCKRLADTKKLDAVFERLDAYRHNLPASDFPNAILSLVNVADLLPYNVRRDFFALDGLSYLWRLIYFGLRKISNEQVHFEALKNGIKDSHGVRLPVQLANLEERNEKRSTHDFLVTEDQLPALRSLAVEALRRAAADGRLRSVPDLDRQLFWWRTWTTDLEVKTWVSSQVNNPNDALWLLRVVLKTSTKTSDKTVYTRYVSLKEMGVYCKVATIEKFTHSLTLEKQNKENMHALRAFRWALKWKAEGKEDHYRGETWDTDGPLTEND